MKTIILTLVLLMSSHAIAIEPGDLPQEIDTKMCDEMIKDIEHFYVQLDPYSDDSGETICYNTDLMQKRKYSQSKLSPKRQHTAKGIIESLCIDFELASCVNYTETNN